MEEVINVHDFKASVKIDDEGRKHLCSLIVYDSKDEHTFDCNIYNELKDVVEIDKDFKLSFTGYGYSVKTFILPSGTTKISGPIFQEVPLINTVVWPDACERIPPYAFYRSRVSHIENTDHIKALGTASFARIPLASFTIPDSIKVLPRECFYNCHELKLLNGLEHIQEFQLSTLSGCTQLRNFPSLDSAEYIDQAAFYETRIRVLDLRKSCCRYIGAWAFAYSGLEEYRPGYYPCEVEVSSFSKTPYSNHR